MRQTVLVVEDEAISRRALTALLTANGFDARAVGSAEEALDLVTHEPAPKFALVDLDLPGMSGIELIRHLTFSNPDLRPVLITATSRERLDKLLEERLVSYMRKPIVFKDLLDVLKEGDAVH